MSYIKYFNQVVDEFFNELIEIFPENNTICICNYQNKKKFLNSIVTNETAIIGKDFHGKNIKNIIDSTYLNQNLPYSLTNPVQSFNHIPSGSGNYFYSVFAVNDNQNVFSTGKIIALLIIIFFGIYCLCIGK